MNLINKLSILSRDSLIKNSYILISDGISTTLLGFAYWFFAARLYEASDIGIGNTAASAVNLVVLFSYQGFSAGIIRLLPQYPEKENQIINSCLTLSLMLLSILISIFYIILPFWSKSLYFFIDGRFLSFILFSFTYLYSLLLDSVFIAKRKTQSLFVKNLQLNIIKIFLLLGLIFLKSNGIYYSWGVSIVLICIIETIILKKNVINSYKPALIFDKKLGKEVLGISMNNHISDVLGSLPSMILPIIIVEIIDAKMVAYFSITWMIMNSLIIISKATTISLFAEASANISELNNMVTKSIKFILSQLFPVLIATLFFGKYILEIFGKEYSANGYPLLFFLTISLIPYSLNTTYFVILRIKNELSKLQLYSFFLTASILILSYFLAIKWKLIGIGVAWLSAQSLCLLIISPKMKNYIKRSKA